MTNNNKLWIRYKNSKYVVQKIDGNSAKQVAKFNTRKQAETYVDKYKVAAAMEKVVDIEYDFKDLFLKFATIKAEGGRNVKTCVTQSGGNKYMVHLRKYIRPYFPDCKLHEVGGAKLATFVDNFLVKGTKPERYKNCKLVLANIRRFLRWCLKMQYHSNFQSAMEYRIDNELKPKDSRLAERVKATVIKPAEARALLEFVWQHRNDSVHAAYACMLFTILFYFGFRASEILGLKKKHINLEGAYVDVQGKFDKEMYAYSSETKNSGSKRKVYFDPYGNAKEKLTWILDYSNKNFPANDYLIAATRGNAPLSPFMFRKILYATYEVLGFAKCIWTKDKNSKKFRIVECKFKGCISKTWRHLKAAQLIQSKNVLQLSEDHIKRVMGHDLYTTTEQIYGDHDLFDDTEHKQLAAKIEQYRSNPIKLIS